YLHITGCQPDSGKPTVRDERGACGNVSYGGTRHPPRLSKERVLETLRLRLCAPHFYPTTLCHTTHHYPCPRPVLRVRKPLRLRRMPWRCCCLICLQNWRRKCLTVLKFTLLRRENCLTLTVSDGF